MTEEMTPEREQEIRARRLDEVTAGPWLVADGENGRPLIYVERGGVDGEVRALPLLVAEAASVADVQFLASARRSVPELLAEVERLRALAGAYQRNQERQAAENEALEERARALQEENAELTAHVEFRMHDIERLRARVAELERPAIEASRNEIRQSFSELAAQAREDRDYEGAFTVECNLRDREEQWWREDQYASPHQPGGPEIP